MFAVTSARYRGLSVRVCAAVIAFRPRRAHALALGHVRTGTTEAATANDFWLRSLLGRCRANLTGALTRYVGLLALVEYLARTRL